MPLLGPILTMLCAGAIVGVTTAIFARRFKATSAAVAVAAACWMVIHAAFIARSTIAARWLPVADVIVWGNLQPLAAGVLAGFAAVRLNTPRWQRLTLLIPLAIFAIYRTVEPIIGEKPLLTAAIHTGRVIRQSSLSTCSAAAAATALRAVGIQASEAEMAELCLTSVRGTFPLGLYRGLKLKTANTAFTVETFDGSFDDLLALPPAVTVINTAASTMRDSILVAGHSMVLFSVNRSGSLEIGDPMAGEMPIRRDFLRSIYRVGAFRLVRRTPSETVAGRAPHLNCSEQRAFFNFAARRPISADVVRRAACTRDACRA